MSNFTFLVTTIKKDKSSILDMLARHNIKGRIIVGNQLVSTDSVEEVETEDSKITIINQIRGGVSANRNVLLNESNADYVSFLDDDVLVHPNFYKYINSIDSLFAKHVAAVRFNIKKTFDDLSQFKQITKRKKLNFHFLSKYSINGIVYDRNFLIKNSISFNEKIGPGNYYNHGEDGLFSHDVLGKGDIIQLPDLCFCVEESISTWYSNRDYERELISHGYIYHFLYKGFAVFRAFLFVLLHKKHFPRELKFNQKFKWMREGIRKAKNDV